MHPGVWLILAICFEVMGTSSLKSAHGFTKWIPSMLTMVFYVISFSFLGLALKKMELSVAYAIWSGLGTALIAIIGFFYFGESATLIKIASIVLIILGVIGLNLSGAH